jgi:hypothetical protein
VLKKVWEKLINVTKEGVAFDPALLNDPVAMETRWTPLVHDGASFRTHILTKKGKERIEFRPAPHALLIAAAFIAVGVVFSVILTICMEEAQNDDLLVPAALGIIIAWVGIVRMYMLNIPIVFDTAIGYFWKGRVKPEEMFIDNSDKMLKKCVSLNQVYALQIVAERCHRRRSYYYSYELNLVLRDGKRMNVIDHGDIKNVRADARALSELLGKTIWDAAGNPEGTPLH